MKSVHIFLRVAHSLSAILVKEFVIPWTNYFDDFVTFAQRDELISVTGSIEFVFKGLGWLFAEDGDKAPDFASNVTALGVQFGVEQMHAGMVTIYTLSRKKDLVQLLDDVISSGKLSRIDALRLRGILQFAAGYLSHPIARKPLNVVTKHAYAVCSPDIDRSTVKALKLHSAFSTSDVPGRRSGLVLCLLTTLARGNISSPKKSA